MDSCRPQRLWHPEWGNLDWKVHASMEEFLRYSFSKLSMQACLVRVNEGRITYHRYWQLDVLEIWSYMQQPFVCLQEWVWTAHQIFLQPISFSALPIKSMPSLWFHLHHHITNINCELFPYPNVTDQGIREPAEPQMKACTLLDLLHPCISSIRRQLHISHTSLILYLQTSNDGRGFEGTYRV